MRLRVFLCFISVMAASTFLDARASDLCPESLTHDQVNNIIRANSAGGFHERIEGKYCHAYFNTNAGPIGDKYKYVGTPEYSKNYREGEIKYVECRYRSETTAHYFSIYCSNAPFNSMQHPQFASQPHNNEPKQNEPKKILPNNDPSKPASCPEQVTLQEYRALCKGGSINRWALMHSFLPNCQNNIERVKALDEHGVFKRYYQGREQCNYSFLGRSDLFFLLVNTMLPQQDIPRMGPGGRPLSLLELSKQAVKQGVKSGEMRHEEVENVLPDDIKDNMRYNPTHKQGGSKAIIAAAQRPAYASQPEYASH